MFKHYPATAAIRIAALSIALAISSAHAAEQPPMISGVYVNEAQSSDGIKAAIKANVASLSFITRPLARKALEGSNPAYRRVVIEQTATEIAVTFDARKPYRVPADGSQVKWTSDKGNVNDIHASWHDGQLLLTSDSENGQRVNAFRLSDDRNTLTLNVTITSPRLDSPLRYELMFRRQ